MYSCTGIFFTGTPSKSIWIFVWRSEKWRATSETFISLTSTLRTCPLPKWTRSPGAAGWERLGSRRERWACIEVVEFRVFLKFRLFLKSYIYRSHCLKHGLIAISINIDILAEFQNCPENPILQSLFKTMFEGLILIFDNLKLTEFKSLCLYL